MRSPLPPVPLPDRHKSPPTPDTCRVVQRWLLKAPLYMSEQQNSPAAQPLALRACAEPGTQRNVVGNTRLRCEGEGDSTWLAGNSPLGRGVAAPRGASESRLPLSGRKVQSPEGTRSSPRNLCCLQPLAHFSTALKPPGTHPPPHTDSPERPSPRQKGASPQAESETVFRCLLHYPNQSPWKIADFPMRHFRVEAKKQLHHWKKLA